MENPLQGLVEENNEEVKKNCTLHIRTPKRIIHFSDGVVEEYSDDESDTPEVTETAVDTKSLTWVPWIKYVMWATGNKAIEYCDYFGEGIAHFLGITTPKYQLEITEHERAEAAEQKARADSAGWITAGSNGVSPLVISQPASASNENPVLV